MDEFEKELRCDPGCSCSDRCPAVHGKSGLFDSLGLDSVDALKTVAVKRKYGVEFKEEDEQNQAIFATLRALANFVKEQRAA